MSKKVKTEPYAVAFIDFLGVKDMIAHDDDGKVLIIFRAACNAALKMCREILGEGDVTIKMFSDNVVLCRRVYNPESHIYDVPGAAKKVVLAASMFQYFILDTMGALVRGGFTVGELYIDNMMVWGQALVEAYRLESERALYPRIVVDPDFAGTESAALLVEQGYFAIDNDGSSYLDYISLVCSACKIKERESLLDRFWQKNLAELEDHAGSTAVLPKLIWHRDYLERSRKSGCAEDENGQAAN